MKYDSLFGYLTKFNLNSIIVDEKHCFTADLSLWCINHRQKQEIFILHKKTDLSKQTILQLVYGFTCPFTKSTNSDQIISSIK